MQPSFVPNSILLLALLMLPMCWNMPKKPSPIFGDRTCDGTCDQALCMPCDDAMPGGTTQCTGGAYLHVLHTDDVFEPGLARFDQVLHRRAAVVPIALLYLQAAGTACRHRQRKTCESRCSACNVPEGAGKPPPRTAAPGNTC